MNTPCPPAWCARAIGAALVAGSAALAAGTGAAQSPQASQSVPFRSGIELIAIDVSVVDKTGAPLRALGSDQFEVTVDGRPRRVISAELVDHAPPPGGTAPGADADEAGSPIYSSNATPWRSPRSGRMFFILVDQGSFGPSKTRAVIAAAKRFVAGLQPTDRVGVFAFPGPGPVVAPTSDHAAVRIALGSLVGLNQPLRRLGPTDLSLSESADIGSGDVVALSAAIDRECRGLRGIQRISCTSQVREEARTISLNAELQTRQALSGMQDVLQALAAFDERKTLVLVSAGLPSSDRAGGGLNLNAEISTLAREAAKANANLYVLHLDSVFLDSYSSSEQHLSRTPSRDASISGSGLETLAGASGGTLLRVATEADVAFDRVLKETSASYMLGLEPLDGDRDGKPHAVRVTVKVPGAHVRSRRDFIIAPAVRTAPANPLAAALSTPRVATAVPMGVSTRTLSVDPAGGLRVLVTAQVGSRLPGSAAFTMGLVVWDSRGRLVLTTQPETQRLVVAPGNRAGSAAYLAALTLPPGDYHLRLAARDADGRLGSVDHAFSVTLAEGDGVMMGDLVLLHPARSADDPLAIIPDGRLRGRTVAAHLEIVATAGDSAPAVTFGVADRADGQLLVQVPGHVSSGNAPGRSTADAVLDLALLPPGNYVAVAVIKRGTRDLGRRHEPLRLEGAASAIGTAGVGGAAATAIAAPRVKFAPGLSPTLAKTFAQADVLTPPALAYFADRVKAADASPPEAVTAALADLRNGRFDAVLAGLSRTSSDRLSAAFLKGVALLATGRPDRAAVELRQALRISDDFLPAAFYLGACYAAGGKDEEAVGAWQTALVTEGEARFVYEVLADALLRLEDAGQAIQVLDEARERWPDDAGFLPRMAIAQAMHGRRADALATLRGYLDDHRTDAEAAALAIRLIFEAREAGQVIVSDESDREAAAMYGEWYRSGGGPNQALVDRWLAFIAKR